MAADDPKEGGVVKKGHEEGLKFAVSLLEEFELPGPTTGYVWILQEKKIEHEFNIITKRVSYDSEIEGYVEKKRIKKLKGVKAKELVLLWPPRE
ncbi:hypothetical protein PanWU01x14_359680 [Parasponia andersonii]|uniref:Uncharacterized protein n=1 Tax=Parasponia andersonii TaxID=3476 RepID=A0A2P5A7Y8_PARAD|nr:hypothetical protein PanWU01x14_359680 [Parasponia andersonii]